MVVTVVGWAGGASCGGFAEHGGGWPLTCRAGAGVAAPPLPGAAGAGAAPGAGPADPGGASRRPGGASAGPPPPPLQAASTRTADTGSTGISRRQVRQVRTGGRVPAAADAPRRDDKLIATLPWTGTTLLPDV